MSFTQGFEKTAGIPEMFGATKGLVQRGTSSLSKGFKDWRKDVGMRAMNAQRAAKNPVAARPVGSAVAPKMQASAEKQLGRKLTSGEAESVAKQAPQKVMDRFARRQDFKAKNKPSFASKHPIITGLGAYGAARYALGGGDQQQQQPQQPVVYAPQGY